MEYKYFLANIYFNLAMRIHQDILVHYIYKFIKLFYIGIMEYKINENCI